ncbi:hypothetical protein L1765_04930 [Microaerobacter geothermalis]|uniref:hypothetical protein n=1 Tax=Microaerobacter geothermalis TaxID=674972 RepID=UPI001F3B83BA|nr:hypothetical protein [Microaerobacter geothermalis]MCF6093340.1 hypothetical protein [Microaerobacter geothermalis]
MKSHRTQIPEPIVRLLHQEQVPSWVSLDSPYRQQLDQKETYRLIPLPQHTIPYS